MGLNALLEKASKEGIEFRLEGESLWVERPENANPTVVVSLREHKEELKQYVQTNKNIYQYIPGSPKRQAFRRRVIDRAGIAWHDTLPHVRETVISKYLPFGDAAKAADAIRRLAGYPAA